MKRQKVRDRWQIALYVPQELVRPLKAEARKQKRAHSATVVEILRHYFGEQEVSKPDAAQQLVRPLKAEARKQKRAHSATVVEILRHYFEQETGKADAAQPAAQ